MPGKSSSTFLILNPVSGGGKGTRDGHVIRQLLDDFHVDYNWNETRFPGHAEDLGRQAIAEGYEHFIICGGDGTLHEVANGILLASGRTFVPKISLIPIGRGNDYCRSLGIPHHYPSAVRLLTSGDYRPVDIGYIRYSDDSPGRYFVNIAGIGFEAFVAARANDSIRHGKSMGKWGYTALVLKSLSKYHASEFTITLNNSTIKRKLFTAAFGKGRYNGGGMMQLPHAHINDGQLAVTLIDDLPKWKIPFLLPRLFSGKLAGLPFATMHHTNSINISSKMQITIEADGEIVGTGDFSIEVISNAVKMMMPI